MVGRILRSAAGQHRPLPELAGRSSLPVRVDDLSPGGAGDLPAVESALVQPGGPRTWAAECPQGGLGRGGDRRDGFAQNRLRVLTTGD